jgi:hypothetical protein
MSGEVFATVEFAGELFAGGRFTYADGRMVNNVARWSGTAWESVGSGVTSTGPSSAAIQDLAVYDDGSGPALFVAGSFDRAGAVEANNVARWDGATWSALSGPGGKGVRTTRTSRSR